MKGYDTYLTNYCKNQNVDKVEKQVTMCLFNKEKYNYTVIYK